MGSEIKYNEKKRHKKKENNETEKYEKMFVWTILYGMRAILIAYK
jgi:hypothetical protein